jgi:hypothetical protein
VLLSEVEIIQETWNCEQESTLLTSTVSDFDNVNPTLKKWYYGNVQALNWLASNWASQA